MRFQITSLVFIVAVSTALAAPLPGSHHDHHHHSTPSTDVASREQAVEARSFHTLQGRDEHLHKTKHHVHQGSSSQQAQPQARKRSLGHVDRHTLERREGHNKKKHIVQQDSSSQAPARKRSSGQNEGFDHLAQRNLGKRGEHKNIKAQQTEQHPRKRSFASRGARYRGLDHHQQVTEEEAPVDKRNVWMEIDELD